MAAKKPTPQAEKPKDTGTTSLIGSKTVHKANGTVVTNA